MNKLIHFLLKYSWIILEYQDSKGNNLHKMNLWNPFAYIALVITAIIGGVFSGLFEGFKTFWHVIKETIKESYAN
jgi:hypothetical protein